MGCFVRRPVLLGNPHEFGTGLEDATMRMSPFYSSFDGYPPRPCRDRHYHPLGRHFLPAVNRYGVSPVSHEKLPNRKLCSG